MSLKQTWQKELQDRARRTYSAWINLAEIAGDDMSEAEADLGVALAKYANSVGVFDPPPPAGNIQVVSYQNSDTNGDEQ